MESTVSMHTPDGQSVDITPAVNSTLLEQKIKDLLSEKKSISFDLRKMRRQYKDIFENDKEYSEILNRMAEVKLQLKKRELQLRDDMSVKALEETIADKAQEVKDIQLSLSDYLKDWVDNGNSHIESNSGDLFEVVVSAKIRKAK
jgi:hemerythrin-like domain-containing protein